MLNLPSSIFPLLSQGRELYFKCELFQKVGAFKFRGAYNAIKKMAPEVTTIITHSSGNHAQAIALAAKMAGKKVRYGGTVHLLCLPTVRAVHTDGS